MTLSIPGLLALVIFIFASFTPATSNADELKTNQALNRLITEQRNELELVGLGAMIMRDGKVVASAVAGERKHRSGVPLTDQDKWHIGSITKSFTATMIARLVERGELGWDTTVGNIFADSPEIHEAWRRVTIEQFLTHTSGASNRLERPFSYLFRDHAEGRERMAERKALTLEFLKNQPASSPGSRFLYSNAGFLIAGVMAERVTGSSWEDLIRREIFGPLGLRSAGFGHPEDGSQSLEQPRGHRSLMGFIISVDDDPTVVIGPAGSIHMSLADLLVYANDHLQGEQGQGKLLRAETYRKLHTPVLDNYAYGWVVKPHAEWSNGPVIWHNGSNGMWDALLAISRRTNTIIAVVSNDGRRALAGDAAGPTLEKAARLLADTPPR